MAKPWMYLWLLSLVAGVGCGVPDETVDATTSALTTTLRGVVSAPNASCNAAVTPSYFVIARGSSGVVELTMPTGGWKIRNWQCAGNLCQKTLVGGAALTDERLELERPGDPGHASGGRFAIVPTEPDDGGLFVCHKDAVTKKIHCDYVEAPACCTCPCDANPGCQ